MRNGTSVFRKPQGGRESRTGSRYRNKLAELEIEYFGCVRELFAVASHKLSLRSITIGLLYNMKRRTKTLLEQPIFVEQSSSNKILFKISFCTLF